MHRSFRSMLFTLSGLLLTAVVHADTYDAASDFSILNNPNGVWSYGYTATFNSPFILDIASSTTFFGGLQQWRSDVPSDENNPSVFYNPTSGSIISVAPGQLAFHPGPNDQFATVRWTAPSAGSYLLTTLFTGIGGGGTDVHVLRDDTDLFDGITTDFGTTAAYSTQLNNLVTGDTIDFKVGYGPDDSYISDTTGLSAQLVSTETTVPEPGTIAIFLASGLIGTALLLRRRRKSLVSGTMMR